MACKLHLDNYSGILRSGTTLSGRLSVHFTSEKNIRGIKIRFKCKERTKWTERKRHYNHSRKRHETRIITHTGYNTPYFVERCVQADGKIGPGSYTYQFSFDLPHDLPSTYEGPYGTIYYYVKAVVDLPCKVDYEDKVHLNVFSPIDLNHFGTNYQLPYEAEDEKTVCCWFCASGLISQKVSVNKRAFAVGETIDVKIKVTNLSNVKVKAFSVKLKQTITSCTKHPGHREKTDTKYISSGKAPGVGAHGEHEFVVRLHIPEVADIPNFSKCELFNAAYKLKVVGEIEGCHSNLDTEIFPLLGHVQYDSNRIQIIYDHTQNRRSSPPPPYMPVTDISFVGGFVQPSGSNGAVFPPLPPHGRIDMQIPNYPSAPFEKKTLDQGSKPSAPELSPPPYDENFNSPKY